MSATRATDEQAAAINSTHRYRVIVAHPGTGKTFTLARIVGELVRRFRTPEAVTAVTFTRNAAAELRDRIAGIVGERDARRIHIGTSTAIALKILRSKPSAYGYPDEITVYDDTDAADVLDDIRVRLGLDHKVSTKRARELIEAKRRGEPGEWTREEERLTSEYVETLRRAGAVEVAEIIDRAVWLMAHDADVRDRFQYRARCLVVDEYHDTAPNERELYRVLDPREVVIVGDPNQEIYGFRGTSNQFLLGAAADEASEVHILSRSFRSDRAIVAAARNLIARNPAQPDRAIEARPGAAPGAVHARRFTAWPDHDEAIVEIVRGASHRGESSAVLVRTNREVALIIRAIRAAGVEVVPLSSERSFLALSEVRLYHAMIRAAINPRDEIAARLVMDADPDLPRWRSPDGFTARIAARQNDQAVLDVVGWTDQHSIDDPGAYADQARREIVERYEGDGLHTRATNVEEAALRAAQWLDDHPGEGLTEYLDSITAIELGDMTAPDETIPRVGTAHAAKGLEFDVVVVAGMVDGSFPLAPRRDADPVAHLWEERRLFYVAATRARHTLYVMSCTPPDDPRRQVVSQFVGEMLTPPT